MVKQSEGGNGITYPRYPSPFEIEKYLKLKQKPMIVLNTSRASTLCNFY